jgi:hypothetical protein
LPFTKEMLMFGRRSIPELLRACAWCDRIDVGGRWVEPDAAIRQLRTYEWSQPPAFTHGVCESCLASLLHKRELARSREAALSERGPWDRSAVPTAAMDHRADDALRGFGENAKVLQS